MSKKHSAQLWFLRSFACLKLFSASSYRCRLSNSKPLVSSACASSSCARAGGITQTVAINNRNNNKHFIWVLVISEQQSNGDTGEILLKTATFYQNRGLRLEAKG